MGTTAVLLLLFVAGFQTVRAGFIEKEAGKLNYDASWESVGKEDETLAEEKMKEFRIETIKLQLLSKLNLKGTPLPSLPPPSESALETIKLLLGETEDQQEKSQHMNDHFDRKERLVIHHKNSDIRCLETTDDNCRLYHYELSTTLNTSSMSLWLYRKDDNPSCTVSVIVSYFNSKEEKSYDKFISETNKTGWNKFDLPSISVPPSWDETFTCSVEVRGENIENRGVHRPFLMIYKTPYIASRQRRDISCDSNESCCMKPLTVSFAEIGLHWVLYPVELQANFCTGKCRTDPSAMRTHYERAMTKILEKDSTLRDSLGTCWTVCCKPKELDSVRVIYNDTEGIIHDQYIPELTVASCSCS